MEDNQSGAIVAIDGNSLLHRAFHALPQTMTAPDGRPTNAVLGFVSMLLKIVQELRPQGVIVAFDKGRPAFRSEALACYKTHRPPTADELKVQFPMIKALLGAMDVPILEVEGWEGDDVLGAIASKAEQIGVRALLVTGDRDAMQLVSDNVKLVSTRKGITDIVIYDREAVLERYGVTPEQIPDYLGLKGDASDNIPGVPGIGEKTAAKLIAEHGSLEAVLSAAKEMRGKLGENLRTHADDALASRLVATIRRDVPIDIDIASVRWGNFDRARVMEAFGELRFTSMLDRVLSSGGADSVDGGCGEKALEDCATVKLFTGATASERIKQWIAEGAWLGIAFDDGTSESLFASHRYLAIAESTGEAAVLEGDHAQDAFSAILGQGKVASGDVKGLLHEFCPPAADRCREPAFGDIEASRLFDCAVAAYLLESNRSSYDLRSLAADYLGRAMPEQAGEREKAAAEAWAAVDLAAALEKRLREDGSMQVFERIEMPLIPVLARMERAGVGLNTGVLEELKCEIAGRIDTLTSEIYDLAGVEFLIDSPKQLAGVLFDKLGLPGRKRTKTGFSTDAGVLAELAPLHPIAEKIVAYRELAKLKSTYIDALPALVASDGRIHTTFNQTVAATGRLSSSAPNLQNIPVRTEFGRRIRAAFVPAVEGDLMVAADYSQIELRILAHLSDDPGLIEAFTSGEDFHAVTASRVFGVAIDEVPAEYRFRAKAVNFGIVYGQSAHGLADSLKVSHAEAQEMIDRYYRAYPKVREYLDETIASAHRDGYASTLFGRKRRIPELKSSNYNLRSFGERTAMNHPMQGTAADIMKLAMIEVDKSLREHGMDAKMLLQVHDELVFECPADELERLSRLACDAMGGVVELSVPLEVNVASGENWAIAK